MNEAEENEKCMHLYVTGKNPTARDIQNFVALFENAVVLSVYNKNFDSEATGLFDEINHQYTEFLKEKYFYQDQRIADDLIDRLTDLLFSNEAVKTHHFIHGPVATYKGDPEIERFNRDLSHYRHQVSREFRESANYFKNKNSVIYKHNLSKNPRIQDFNDWVGYKYGNRLLETEYITTKNSIEILFNLTSVGAILGFQQIPEIKEIALYLEAVFNQWLGRRKLKNNNEMKIPSLPASMERTISKFDNVELTQNNEGWTIKLNKNP